MDDMTSGDIDDFLNSLLKGGSSPKGSSDNPPTEEDLRGVIRDHDKYIRESLAHAHDGKDWSYSASMALQAAIMDGLSAVRKLKDVRLGVNDQIDNFLFNMAHTYGILGILDEVTKIRKRLESDAGRFEAAVNQIAHFTEASSKSLDEIRESIGNLGESS
jgi:hypothetical protein